ncbi:hypothetical protein [Paraglaciecola sp.]|uniref:hypothetical protein n=1 Tax=Paraglaciecola sp. TaxID=1920173 RepID=UPI0030F4A2AE
MNLIKNSVISILCLVVSVFENAAVAGNLSSSMLTCNKKTNDVERLRCYDDLNLTLKTDTIEKHIADDTLQQTLQPLPVKPISTIESFGLPDKLKAKEEIENIVAHVTSVDHNLRKKLVVSLDIGQIWEQTDGTNMRLREGDSISLERGALGSFFLGVEGKNKRMRVKRIK